MVTRTASRAAIAVCLALAVTLAVGASPAWASFTKPWDDLTAAPSANWIDPYAVNMYAANNSNAYPVSFSTAKANGGARGMNTLRFVDTADAHHVSSVLTGSVNVLATGAVPFSEVLVLVAIDAASLPADFVMTMNGYACSPQADFCYYDGAAHAAGRPSGYYPSATSPESEPIAYDFNRGMVTVLAFTGVLDSAHPFALNYSFTHLPAPAVFSVYGWPAGGTEIYHTNRGVPDVNDPAGYISTFEVLPMPGDANGDGVVDAADFVILKRHMGAGSGAGAAGGDFDYDGDVDRGDLGILTANFGVGGGAPGTVPEPASLALLACGAAAAIVSRRRRKLA